MDNQKISNAILEQALQNLTDYTKVKNELLETMNNKLVSAEELKTGLSSKVIAKQETKKDLEDIETLEKEVRGLRVLHETLSDKPIKDNVTIVFNEIQKLNSDVLDKVLESKRRVEEIKKEYNEKIEQERQTRSDISNQAQAEFNFAYGIINDYTSDSQKKWLTDYKPTNVITTEDLKKF